MFSVCFCACYQASMNYSYSSQFLRCTFWSSAFMIWTAASMGNSYHPVLVHWTADCQVQGGKTKWAHSEHPFLAFIFPVQSLSQGVSSWVCLKILQRALQHCIAFFFQLNQILSPLINPQFQIPPNLHMAHEGPSPLWPLSSSCDLYWCT